MEFNRITMKKLLILVFSGIAFYLVLSNFGDVTDKLGMLISIVFPFILGTCFAFIINVPMSRIENALFRSGRVKKGKRIISFFITIALIIGIIAIALNIIIPQIAVTLYNIAKELPEAADAFQAWVMDRAGVWSFMHDAVKQFSIDWGDIAKDLSILMKNVGTQMVNTGIGAVTNIVGMIVNFFIGLIFSVYILMSKEKLGLEGKQVLFAVFSEKTAKKIIYVLTLSNRTFSRFISGQCLEACILGLMFFVSMSIFRLPYAMLISVMIAFTALIPIVGAFIGCIFGCLFILLENPVQALFFIILFLILQQIEGNIVYPHVVGSSVGLPSMWVLVAVTVGGKLMGVFGMVLFIPICSVLYSLFRLFVKDRLKKKEISSDIWTKPLNLEECVMTGCDCADKGEKK